MPSIGRKYGNKRFNKDGYTWDSIKEYQRYRELLLLERGNLISNIEVHPKFVLQEGFRDWRAGETLQGKPGKVQAITYSADFSYWDRKKQKTVVEDVKSTITAKNKEFRIKRALFLYKYQDCDFRIVIR